jgi:small subunit ribosomal protein S16e
MREEKTSQQFNYILLFGQKTATAVAFVKKGAGLIKVNGVPISLLQPEILKLKTFEPVLLIGTEKFANVSFSYLR